MSGARGAFGHYQLYERVSSGGMAEVFRARDAKREMIVAVKRILPEIAEDPEFIEMFEDEARIASQLEHPYIARMLDYGAVGDEYFIAFELVDGRDLRALFGRLATLGEAAPLDVVLYVFTRIAEGLSYAHGRRDASGAPVSIVHRDVSPQNIIVSYEGDVKLIDFGIAKAAGKVGRTRVGALKGKFGYMAPEQVIPTGAPIDQRVDVFGLGICLWELLTMRRLFEAPNEVLVLEKLRSSPIAPPSSSNPEVPAELDRIVLKSLAKNPDERYRSARELYRDLNYLSQNIKAVATREQIAQYMRRTFPEGRGSMATNGGDLTSSGERGELRPDVWSTRLGGEAGAKVQESVNMSGDNKGGSDLDIFEGLGKKNTLRPPASAPPPAPPSRAPGPLSSPPPGASTSPSLPEPRPAEPRVAPLPDMPIAKRTLLGMPAAGATPSTAPPPPPANATPLPLPPSGSVRPPPPPGRATLPPVVPPPPKTGMGLGTPASMGPPPSSSTRPPSQQPPPASSSTAAAPKAKGASLDMDWDDEDEATHIFDKDKPDDVSRTDRPRPNAGAMMATPAPAPANASRTLLGLTAPTSTPQAQSQSNIRPSAPPSLSATSPSGPPSFGGAFARTSGAPANGPGPASAPPPTIDPLGGATAGPNAFPSNGPGRISAPPPPPGMGFGMGQGMGQSTAQGAGTGMGQSFSQQTPGPFAPQNAAAQTMPDMPPAHVMPNRMEMTALVRPPSSGRTGLFVGLGAVGAAVIAGALFLVMMPRTGSLRIDVSDEKGATIEKVDIAIDGRKQCDTTPCIVDQLSAGSHVVKVTSSGYESSPPTRDVVVESRTQTPLAISLTSVVAKPSTGLKLSGNQSGVKLFVDDKEIGPLPQELKDIEPGTHKIKLAGSDRYAPLEKTITVSKDEMLDLGSQALKVVKGKATISLATPGAKVYLVSGSDRRELPTLPIQVDIDTSKSWTLESSKAGMTDYKQPISFEDGQAEKTFTVTLEPKSSGGAAVAAAPAVASPPAEPKEPRVAAAPRAPAAPAAAKTPAPAAAAEPKAPAATGADTASGEAFLNINSIPPSSVVLDGKPLGNTPRVKVSVKPGTHTVLFVNADEGLKKQVSVTLAAGETKAAVAKLRD